MPSEQEIQYHRTFLSYNTCRTIYNEDERHQYNPGGVPNRQQKIDSDPVFKYHVHSCPRYPQRAPGQPIDPQYNALLARDNGSFDPLVIMPKRGQRFAYVATPWELQYSVLCGGSGKFNPVVNSWMEVTGHSAKVRDTQLIRPKGIDFADISDYIKNDIPIYLWMYQVFNDKLNHLQDASLISLPPGWERVRRYLGGVSVLVLPNGKVIGARGHPLGTDGQAISVLSPVDFFTPGRRLVESAIRGLTNRVGGAVSAGFRFLSNPTKELAESTVALLAGKTLPGMAVSPRVALQVVHSNGRSILMGEDMLEFRLLLAESKPLKGFYDVMIHGDETSFLVRVATNPKGEGIFEKVSVREVADAVRPRLKPGETIRLLSCATGCTGGPAQEFANQLNHKVWGPSTKLPAAPTNWGPSTKNPAAPTSTFVPVGGGKFFEFVPQRGTATLAGKGGKVTENKVEGVVRTK